MNVKLAIDSISVDKMFGKAVTAQKQAAKETADFFVKTTPIRSGNARSRTSYDDGQQVIEADYAYAERLDQGYSKQAPKGMTEPSIKYYENRLAELIRKIP